MNAKEFYDEFSAALTFLGPGFGSRELVEVYADRDVIFLTYGKRQVAIEVMPNIEIKESSTGVETLSGV